MNRNRITVLLLVILLLSNGLLLYLYLNKPGERPRMSREERLKEMLMREVGFDEKQVDSFKVRLNKHRESMKPLADSLIQARNRLFDRYVAGDTSLQPLWQNVQRLQRLTDEEVLKHLRDVRSICKPGQEAALDKIMRRVLNRRGGGGPPGGRPPRGRPEKPNSEKPDGLGMPE
jgi:hypothetical protein